MNDSEQHYIFFSYSVGIGPKTFIKLLDRFKSVEKIYDAHPDDLLNAGIGQKNLEKYLEFRSRFNLGEVIDQIEDKKIWVLCYKDYPESFKTISNPPICLYGKGDKSLVFEKKRIGIVGSRRPTSYGASVTESFTHEFVNNGFVVVSGMALGIDSIAHRTCLKNDGKTIAVLGSGVDVPTPNEHYNLYQEIIKSGGAVVSEFPLGMQPNKGSFPARNRIISALSQAILIPEATSDSGALITAKEAFSQGRKVFVVPGPITSNLSKGTNSLLSHGGIAIGSAEEITRELGIKNYESSKNKNRFNGMKFSKTEAKILHALENEELSIDELKHITGFPIGELMVCLTELELHNIVENLDGKWQIKI